MDIKWEKTDASYLTQAQKSILENKGIVVREKANGTLKVYRGDMATTIQRSQLLSVVESCKQEGYHL